MNTTKIRKTTSRARKPRRGRPAVNKKSAVVQDKLGSISPDVALQSSCLRAYMQLGNMRAVADALGISVGLAHRHISEGYAYLREAGSPEHRAAVLGLVDERVNHLWRTVDGALSLCVASGQIERIASLATAGARLGELLAKLYGIGGDYPPPVAVDSARLAEIARRLTIHGVHSRASEMAAAHRPQMPNAQGVTP